MRHVDCLTCREAISARLDGEPEPVPAEHTDEHLASCASCRAWQARVTATARTLRVRRAPEVPDLTAAILATAVPPSGTRGWWARIALITVATAQLSLALGQMLGVGAHTTEHVPVAGHLFNESTAWNVALGVGLLWAAFRTRVTSGLIPVLSGFVLLLGIYSAHDLVNGTAPVARVLGHGLLLLGLGLLIVINRRYGDPAPQPGAVLDDTRDDLPGGAAPLEEPAEAGQEAAGGSRRHRHLRPAGRHRAA
jgi:predicted anti-sigma-YlaC factor YlaD